VLGLMKRYLPWLACVVVAALAVPPRALANAESAQASAASFVAYDFGFRDATKTADDPTATTVTVTPGSTVDFSYPTGSSVHNVHFGDAGTGIGPQPTSCAQTAGPALGAVPPLPTYTLPQGWAGNCTFNTPGTYTFYCEAHPFMTGTVVVKSANQAPTVHAARTPTGDVVAGTAVSFTATASDPDNDTLTYSWDFGDSGTSTAQNPTHTFLTPGTYSAKVTVDDGHGGTASDTVSVTVTQPNRPPTVTAARTPTGDVAAGTAISFTATASDPDGDTLTYLWDFGDGSTSTQQNPTHTYTTAGAYSAKVTVSDGKGGTANATSAVTVTGSSCPPGTFRDDFNGSALASSWSVVRPSGALQVGNGVVSIPTEPGDIYQATNTATNIVLRPAPTGAFTITAKINHHGLTRYQQAGIIVYGDDDNYTKFDRTATNNGGTPVEKFEFINEVAGTPRNTSADYTPNIDQSTFPQDFYLRITSTDGTTITGAYSTDGTTWTNVGKSANVPANPKVGLLALSNGATTTVTPTFDWFQMDGPNVQGDCGGGGGDQSPVISAAAANPTNGVASLPVSFTSTASDPDNDTLLYSWDFGDGATSTSQNPSHTYTTGGTFNAKLTVSDGKGGSAVRTIPVTVLPPDSSAKFRALIFSKTAAFRHDSIPNGIAAIQTLGQQNNWQVDATEDGSLFRDDVLSHYKVVIFLSTTGDVLTDDQQAAFQRFIEAGHGYVGIHSAADTEYTWPWYGRLVGAYFRDHPNGTPTATVQVEDTTDPSTAGLPARWTRTDEWYNFQTYDNPVTGGGTSATPYDPRNNTDLHILLTTDTSTYTGAAPAGTDHPIAWCHRYDGGRSWYTALGHTQASYTEPLFLSHISAGIQIAAGTLPSAACGVAPTNRAPTVTAARTPTGNVASGTAVSFTANGSDADGDTLTYSWDFGDTGTSTQQNPTHTYTTPGTYTAKVTVDDGKGGSGTDSVSITVTGGTQASTDASGTVNATVGSFLGLSLAPSATLGPVVPGVTRDYTVAVTGTVTSTDTGTQLTVHDPSPNATGHLVNGQYALASPLQAQASDATHPASAFAAITGATSPLLLMTFTDPVNSDPVSIGFKQTVAAGDVLRAGSYAKTLTFTLTSATP
jgi:cytochrome c